MQPAEWPRPWQHIPLDQRLRFEQQLQREVSPGHPLFGVAATAVARGYGDAVLFMLPSHTRPLAVVHLTWEGPQRDPRPQTEFYDSAADLPR
jgi:hypothetical protein